MSQRETGDKTKLIVADNVWIYVAISFPFTICTVIVWWVWVRFQSGLIRLPKRENLFRRAGMFVGRGRTRFKSEIEHNELGL